MIKKKMTAHAVRKFVFFLQNEEKSKATISKYRHDINKFMSYLSDDKYFNKDTVIAYKNYLTEHYAVSSVNSMLAALNKFLEYQGWSEFRVKSLRVQKKVFSNEDRQLKKSDYVKLLQAARRAKKRRLYLVILTLCCTGIRVSELSYITVEAVKSGQARVACKNKTRWILIPHQLKAQLLDYARESGLKKGRIFITSTGRQLDRSNIWRDMKKICREADVNQEKVFPHNLRHLFARTFYEKEKDIVKLSDILGHSNIETTRIYTLSTGKEYARQLHGLGLII